MKTEEKAGQVRRKKKAAAAPSGVKRRRPQNIKKTAPQSKTAPARKRKVSKPTPEQAARQRTNTVPRNGIRADAGKHVDLPA